MTIARRPTIFLLCLMLITALMTACNDQPPASAPTEEILVYCGATMAKPMRQIADLFEQQENCRVKMIKGGSGTLYRSIQINQAGDLYLPGSESYIIKAQTEGLVTTTANVGYNRAALIVAKGNPLNISANLNNLTNQKYRTILGSPDSGSIGRETKRILQKADLYDQALDNTLYLTSDSKGLKQAIIDNNADLTLNWYATAIWQENSNKMDVLRLAEAIAPPHHLILGVLKYARHPDLAQRFITFAASTTGKEIFERYGFGGDH